MKASIRCMVKKSTWKNLLLLITILGLFLSPISAVIYYNCRIETTYIENLTLNLDSRYSALNGSQWVAPSFQQDPFIFEVETFTKSNTLFYNNTAYSVDYYNLGTTDWYKANCTEWGEWGYSFNHLTDGAMDGAGVIHYGGYPTPPETKQEAYEYMRAYVVSKTQTLYENKRPWVSFNGHYPFHHYAAEFGFDKIGTEIGENMESYQMLMAFNRGAARQYNLPWFVDVSAWYGAGITDYNNPGVWGKYSGVTHGHSLELYRRSYYMAYMAGASRLIAEAGAANFFNRTGDVDPNGLMQLSPLGEVGEEFAHFSQTHPNRGIPYTPIALYIDEYHGTEGIGNSNLFSRHKTFNSLPYTKGDKMTYHILDTIFPGGWDENADERCQLANSEFGDTFDIILQNATAEVLESYPVILMSGEIYLDGGEKSRLVDYVEAGGTAIVNSAYFDQINSEIVSRTGHSELNLSFTDNVKVLPFGNNGGNFVLYGKDYKTDFLTPILRELRPKLMPFNIHTFDSEGTEVGAWGAETDIQYMINRNEQGWVLTLINNDGISKTHFEAPQIDPLLTRTVRISLNSQFLSEHMEGAFLNHINNWMTDENHWNPDYGGFSYLELTIAPGDVAIFEFGFD